MTMELLKMQPGEETTSLPQVVRRRVWIAEFVRWVTGTVLAVLVGTWLVWLYVSLQQSAFESEIRAACRRTMPESADRCFDTVIIQRGGTRR